MPTCNQQLKLEYDLGDSMKQSIISLVHPSYHHIDLSSGEALCGDRRAAADVSMPISFSVMLSKQVVRHGNLGPRKVLPLDQNYPLVMYKKSNFFSYNFNGPPHKRAVSCCPLGRGLVPFTAQLASTILQASEANWSS